MTKKDKIKKEYKKQRKRVLSYIRSLDKKDLLYAGKVPDIPKNITQGSINRLKKLTAKYIKDHSYYINKDTGEQFDSKRDYLRSKEVAQVTAPKREDKPQKRSDKKSDQVGIPRQEDMLINSFLDNAKKYPAQAYPFLSGWLSRLIDLYSKKDVAIMLQRAEDNGVTLSWEIAYSDELLNQFALDLTHYLPEAGDFTVNALEDLLEDIEDYVDYG